MSAIIRKRSFLSVARQGDIFRVGDGDDLRPIRIEPDR